MDKVGRCDEGIETSSCCSANATFLRITASSIIVWAGSNCNATPAPTQGTSAKPAVKGTQSSCFQTFVLVICRLCGGGILNLPQSLLGLGHIGMACTASTPVLFREIFEVVFKIVRNPVGRRTEDFDVNGKARGTFMVDGLACWDLVKFISMRLREIRR